MSKYTGGLPSTAMDGCSNNSFSNVFSQITVAAASIAGSEKTNSNFVWCRILDEERASFLWMCSSTLVHRANKECSYVLPLPQAHDNLPYFFLFLSQLRETGSGIVRNYEQYWQPFASLSLSLSLPRPFKS